MNRIAGVVGMLLIAVASMWGQAFTVSVSATVNGGNLDVDFYIQSPDAFVLGTSSFLLDYNTALLGSPARVSANDGPWNNSEGDYSLYVSKGTGYAGLTVEFTGNDNLNGPSVTSSATRIGTVRFVVLDASGTEHFAWRGVGTTTQVLKLTSPGVNMDYLDITASGTFVSPGNTPLPVTLVSLKGSSNASTGGVMLEWKTTSEVNNYGYTVQRKAESDEDFADLKDAFVAGKGTTVEPQAYSYVDKSIAKAGRYTYRLKQQDLDGTVHYTQSVIVNVTITDVAEVAPRMFQLIQNYPNPFNPSTQLKFSVDATTRATVKIYNTLGEEVATMFDGVAEAGRYYAARFNATGLASGVYLYRLTTEQKTAVKRMMLVK